MYRVGVVPDGLTREEAISQICRSIQQIDEISADVISRVNTRLDFYRSRFESFTKRLSDAENKVQSLKSRSNEAIAVFSPARYPDAIVNYPPVRCLFDRRSQLPELDLANDDALVERKIVVLPKPDVQKIAREKLVHYSVQLDTKNEDDEPRKTASGYGSIPQNVRSVSDLLVFNTSLNPYAKTDRFENPFLTRCKTRQTLEVDQSTAQANEIGSAPVTLTDSNLNERDDLETFSYMPDFAEVPEFDIPEFLPDLPGIAADMSFANATAAPSFDHSFASFSPCRTDIFSVSAVTTPPQRDPPSSTVFTPPSISGAITALSSTTSKAPPSSQTPKMPASTPPAPPLSATSLTLSPLSSPAGPGALSPPPPPPPPPPPTFSAVDKKPPSASLDRSDLLKSIREAGGMSNFKFSSARDRRRDAQVKRRQNEELGGGKVDDSSAASAGGTTAPTSSAAAAAPPTGGMMADLTRALTLRRRGIAGRHDEAATRATSSSTMLARLSDAIPATPVPLTSKVHVPGVESTDDDEEWRDR